MTDIILATLGLSSGIITEANSASATCISLAATAYCGSVTMELQRGTVHDLHVFSGVDCGTCLTVLDFFS